MQVVNSSEPVLNLLSAGSVQLLTPVLPPYYVSTAGEHSTGNSLIQSKVKISHEGKHTMACKKIF